MDLCLLLVVVVFLGECSPGQSDPCTGHGCQCTGVVNIDLSWFFNYPVTGIPDTIPGNAQYSYSFSPCSPMTCYTGQADTAALCQYDSEDPSDAVSLGGVQNISWSVVSEDEFTLTITGGSPAFAPHRDRQSTVKFQYVSNVSTNQITFLGEDQEKTTITYKFAVQFSTTNARGGCQLTFGPHEMLIVLLVMVVTVCVVGGLFLYFVIRRRARGACRKKGYLRETKATYQYVVPKSRRQSYRQPFVAWQVDMEVYQPQPLLVVGGTPKKCYIMADGNSTLQTKG